MIGLVDLHTHSTASDGSMTPRELVRHAKRMGLCAIAITDHDTTSGIEEALDESEKIGMKVIPGIEISVDFEPEMHMLGYFSERTYVNISGTLERLKKNRDERNPKIIKKLNELGFDITLEEAVREAGGKIVGRPHMAKVLMDKGYIGSIKEGFDKYLSSGKTAFVKKDKLTPAEGIAEILKAGGVPVIAHPIYLNMKVEDLDSLLYSMASSGLMGIEGYYVENMPEDTENLLWLARKHKLIVTGGSDYHGNFKPDIEIGIGHGNLRVPCEVVNTVEELLNKKNPS